MKDQVKLYDIIKRYHQLQLAVADGTPWTDHQKLEYWSLTYALKGVDMLSYLFQVIDMADTVHHYLDLASKEEFEFCLNRAKIFNAKMTCDNYMYLRDQVCKPLTEGDKNGK